jgi:hypothetical protein
MTSRWARTSKTFLASTVVCTVGVLGCGFLSSRGNLWERFTIVSAFGVSCSMFATLGIALIYYLKIRFELNRLVHSRPQLTDQTFISLSPRLKGVDPFVVHLIREAAAKEFRSIGGERFQPDDDLEADLHLSDLTFSGGEWLEGVATDLGIDEEELSRGSESVPVQTYGDLVLLFDRLSWRSNGEKSPCDQVERHPVWDDILDR